MCYNCGCGLPNENHGHPNWITNETFDKAKNRFESREDIKKNVMDSLRRELERSSEQREISKTKFTKAKTAVD